MADAPLTFLIPQTPVPPNATQLPEEVVLARALERCGHTVLDLPRATAASDKLPALPEGVDCVVVMHEPWTAKALTVWRDELRKRGHGLVVQWIYDLLQRDPNVPLTEQTMMKRLWFDRMKVADMTFIKDKNAIAELGKMGINAMYLDQGVVQDYRKPAAVERDDWRCDVAFCGTPDVSGLRLPVLMALRGFCDVKVFATDYWQAKWRALGFICPGECSRFEWDTLGKSARIMLCADHRSNVPGFWSNRMWLGLGAQCCVLAERTPGITDVVKHDCHLMLYDSVADAADKTNLLLADPERRLHIARAGHAHALRHHMTEHRCEETLVPVVRKCLAAKLDDKGRRTISIGDIVVVPPIGKGIVVAGPEADTEPIGVNIGGAVRKDEVVDVAIPARGAKNVLLIAPWTAQGLTTMAVYHGRTLEVLGHHVSYHAWHGIYTGPGWPEDEVVNIGKERPVDLDTIDVAIWYGITDATQVTAYKERGIKTIWIPMWQSIGTPNPDKYAEYDIVVCPTVHTYKLFGQTDAKNFVMYTHDAAIMCCPWWCNFPRRDPRPTPDVPVFFHCIRGPSGDDRNTTSLLHAWKAFKRQRGVGTLIIKSLVPIREVVEDYTALPDLQVIESHITRNALTKLYHAADCFVCPTKGEAVGLVLQEALCATLPIAVTNAPPMTEWLTADNGIGLPIETFAPTVNGTLALVGVRNIVAALETLRPPVIDQMKEHTHDGLSERALNFERFWTDALAGPAKKQLTPMPAGRTLAPSHKPHLVMVAKNWGLGRGGGELSTIVMLEAAKMAGYHVSCLYMYRCGPPPDWLTGRAVMPASMGDTVRALHPDILLCNMESIQWIGPIARAYDLPLVCYVQFWRSLLRIDPKALTHLDDWLEQDKPAVPDDALDPAADEVRRATALVSNSAYTARVVEMAIGRHSEAIARPYIKSVRKMDGPRDCVLLPSFQRLKGSDEFLALAKRHPDKKFLLLAGDCVIGRPQIAAAQNMPNVEIIWKWVQDMAPIYARTKVLMIGTRSCESYCRVAAEARSLGIPILALKAGNLPHHLKPLKRNHATRRGWIACANGALVERDGDLDAWNNALFYCTNLKVKAETGVLSDDRHAMITVLDNHRLFGDIATLCPVKAPGIAAAIEHLSVLGCKATHWNTSTDELRDFAAVIVPGQWREGLAALPGQVVIWWCSHLAQMDTSRHEAEALAKIIALLKGHPKRHIAFTCQADAKLWASRGVNSWWLPAILEDTVVNVPKRPGLNVFIPGPYRERKNVFTALGAAAMCKADVHVTGLATESRGMKELAEAMGVQVTVHPCPTTASVLELAGSCQVALAISTAETFSYGAAECVQAGTPTVFWAGIPALTTGPEGLSVQDPTNVAEVATAVLWAAEEGPHLLDEQRRALKRTIAPHVAAARKTLLAILAGGKR